MAFENHTGSDRDTGGEMNNNGIDRRVLANNIKCFNIKKALERFEDNWDALMEIVQSFSSNVSLLIARISSVNADTLSDYAVTVHGIKSSCRSICANSAGNWAEALENAAKKGDMEFIASYNPVLVELVTALIAEINETFGMASEKTDKPQKDKPSAEELLKLRKACEAYNATGIDAVMKGIETFHYTADDGLVLWLRENVIQMNYTEIIERLSGLP